MARKRNAMVKRGAVCKVIRLPYRAADGEWYEENYCHTHGKWMLDCLMCGQEFHSDRPHTKWCSCSCSQKNYRANQEVATCR